MNHALQLRKFADRCMASDVERAGLRAAAAEIDRLRNLKLMSNQELLELRDACEEEISRRDQTVE